MLTVALIPNNFSPVRLALLAALLIFSTAAYAQKRKRQYEQAMASIKSREAEFYFTEAEKFFMLEDYAKALAHYQKVLDIQPNNATVHYRMAEVFLRSNRPDDLQRAAQSIETALRFEQKNKYFYLLGATIYLNQTRYEQAARLYETMMNQIPGTEEYLYELAAVYKYANRSDEAIKTYNRAEQIFGVTENSSIPKQQLYLESGKIKEALAEGDKLVKTFPEEERYAVGYAELLSRYNQKNQAVTVLETYLEINPQAPNASLLLAGLYRDIQQEDKARKLIQNLFDNPDVEMNSKLIVLNTYSEELNRLRNNHQKDESLETFALQLFEKLKKIYPDEAQIKIIGGDLYQALGKTKEAITLYQEATQKGAVNFEVWHNLIYLEIQSGNFEAAIRHASEALEYYPNQALLYYFSGMAHLRRRSYQQAVNMLEQGKKLTSNNPALTVDILALLGEAFNGLREYAKSDKAFEEALALSPNNEIVLNNYSYYLALRGTNLERAEKLSAQLIKAHPDNNSFLDTHAWVLYKQKKYREARKIMERVIGSGRANAIHLEHYGDILYQLGDVDAAVLYWKKAREQTADLNELLDKKIANRKLYE
ncbi:MAG: tetratricopeptide repeat protein [Cyclobacteriaceae bacterium]|nr:tetratricopeptide repeat protein [Cyclobacteriaceae bacterium]MCX7636742.1 tetratricopeptide repeat protein [Cyclobacteriaceae bacterium]MDW8330637.1 tetratricopeptide repeat protein [Cyclobacteriaceae bacterium]